MKDLSDVSAAEAEKCLSRLKMELEDIEEERLFILRQTGLHVSAGTAAKYERELGDLRAQIEELEQIVRVDTMEHEELAVHL